MQFASRTLPLHAPFHAHCFGRQAPAPPRIIGQEFLHMPRPILVRNATPTAWPGFSLFARDAMLRRAGGVVFQVRKDVGAVWCVWLKVGGARGVRVGGGR